MYYYKFEYAKVLKLPLWAELLHLMSEINKLCPEKL